MYENNFIILSWKIFNLQKMLHAQNIRKVLYYYEKEYL